jgi:hypothetical protein
MKILNRIVTFVLAVAVLIVSGIGIYTFINYPTNDKIQKVKEWLLFAVTQAETEFGTSTGQIKLRYVYDLFIAKFPAISKVISFDSFSLLVDEALEQFKKLLINNKTLQEKVYGSELDEAGVKKLQEQIGSDSNE